MIFERSSGILLHPTSLPGPHGVGDLGPEAYRFIDFLHAAGQRWWQVLPLGPVGDECSPYNAQSSFAGNPLLISDEPLIESGLIDQSERFESVGGEPADFELASKIKEPVFRLAFLRFKEHGNSHLWGRYEAFSRANSSWLDDFVLFQVLRNERDGQSWSEWEPELARRDPDALDRVRREHADEMRYYAFLQFLFDSQWRSLKHYGEQRGIKFIGDIPSYVAHDSSDVWAHQDLFLLDHHGRPAVVAGVPPDIFSETGQLWGNPVYDWAALAEDDYRWWVDRFHQSFERTGIVRVDHFRAFVAGWQIPAGEQTAIEGRWVPGPGMEIFRRLNQELHEVPIIVEDLGIITPDVHELREQLGYPGMKILQFAFGEDNRNPYLPHNYEANCVVYTGTHDNDTTRGWYASATPEIRAHVDRYIHAHSESICWALIRLALSSVARLAIIPAQDILELDTSARMNMPGTTDGNWRWRLTPGSLTHEHAVRLGELTELYRR